MARPVVAFTVTFYTSVDEVRCALALRLCEVAAECQIPLVVVDASPDPAVPAAMIERGATVHPQQSKGKKGAALREAISRALPLAAPKGVLLWLEPEKVDMLRHAAVTARPIIQRDAEVTAHVSPCAPAPGMHSKGRDPEAAPEAVRQAVGGGC